MSHALMASAVWFGYEVTTLLVRSGFDYLVRIGIGAGVGISVQTLVLFLTSLFWFLDKVHCLAVCLLFCAASTLLFFVNRRYSVPKVVSYQYGEIIVLLFALLLSVWGAQEVNLKWGQVTRSPGLGDLPFHMNIIQSFARGVNSNRLSLFDVWSPFHSGIPLAYPMFHHFYSACLMRCGDVDITGALFITACVMSFAFVVLTYEVFKMFCRDRMTAMLSVPTLFLLGGLGWTMAMYSVTWGNNECNWVKGMSRGITAFWMQPFVHIMLPQRSALFAQPMCLGSILCFFKGVKRFEKRYFVLAGLCTGFLPQLQVHSFVAVAQFALTTCVLFLPPPPLFRRAFIAWAIYGFISLFIGLPLMVPYWNRIGENHKSFVRMRPVWKGESDYGATVFPLISVWWRSTGPFGIVMYLFGWIGKTKWQMKFWGSAMVVCVAASLITYQPWEVDNIKLLYAVWMPIAVPYVVGFYMWVWRRSKHSTMKIIVAFLLTQGMFSGFLSYVHELWGSLMLCRGVDMECGDWIAENTPIDSVFISFEERFNPVSSHAGRQLFNGFLIWLRQHGIANWHRKELSKLMAVKGDSEMFRKYGVEWILHSDEYNPKFKPGLNDTNWILVFELAMYKIYTLDVGKLTKMNLNSKKQD